jgi:MFS family permease
MKLESKRWLILSMGILANMCMGAAYASSVFAKPLLVTLDLMKMGPSGPVPDMVKWALAFSVNLACLPLGMLLSGRIADIKSPRAVVIGGGILFGLGMLLTGYAGSFAWVLFFFGVVMGIGSGAAYGAVVSTSVRWFPDMRGLASGLSVGALGCGTLIIAPIAQQLMAGAPDGQTPVLWAFKILGTAFIVVIALASFFMVTPPAGYKPAGWIPKQGAPGSSAAKDYTWRQLFGRLEFWVLYAMYACGTFSGLMIISQASPIAQKMTKLSPVEAVGIVSLMGLANAVGRVFWGFVSDKAGRLNALFVMFIITGITMFFLPQLAMQKNTLLIGALFVGACYGGYLGIFPSVTADYFGTKNLALNYAVIFSAFSIAAIAGPRVASQIVLATDSYAKAFMVAGAVCVAGAILTIFAARLAKRTKPNI